MSLVEPSPVDADDSGAPAERSQPARRPRSFKSRALMLVRRVHLYAGLFLLPWVFLYGVTGAMFNHHDLFPHPTIETVDARGSLIGLPTPAALAEQVTAALDAHAADATVALHPDGVPEYTGDLMFETWEGGARRVVHLDPITGAATVETFPENAEQPEALLKATNLKLSPDPFLDSQQDARTVLQKAGIDQKQPPKPLGWTKLNYLVTVDGEPARVTYVLKDGHVDVERYTGEDGMNPRAFFLRLHTSHGQPPHWNYRFVWSLFVDAMAIAMVGWGLTGLVMWWTIKRTRLFGAAVLAASVATAAVMYFGMEHYYASTKL
ncbi:PepSY domain-containing protein [Alienimonas californiensis]|uniref:PepSY-associated TM helix n=1 Tax=Alienimonas californiensis TaxID=2527989 RepID=A0A517P633_9PLAN|nr:PepSY domain-containing protein [Alienimonas californiensis]QDT14834.1 hypothetical protein CA12_09140 [Alienimonas californiensis]